MLGRRRKLVGPASPFVLDGSALKVPVDAQPLLRVVVIDIYNTLMRDSAATSCAFKRRGPLMYWQSATSVMSTERTSSFLLFQRETCVPSPHECAVARATAMAEKPVKRRREKTPASRISPPSSARALKLKAEPARTTAELEQRNAVPAVIISIQGRVAAEVNFHVIDTDPCRALVEALIQVRPWSAA